MHVLPLVEIVTFAGVLVFPRSVTEPVPTYDFSVNGALYAPSATWITTDCEPMSRVLHTTSMTY